MVQTLLYCIKSVHFLNFFPFLFLKNNEISNITDIENVSSICNLNIAMKQAYTGENLDVNSIVSPFPKTKKDIDYWLKNTPKRKNFIAGFRDYSLDKFVNIITDTGYTTAVYVQDKDATGKIIINAFCPFSRHVYI